MANTIKNNIKTRQVAILAANGADDSLMKMKTAVEAKGAQTKIISLKLGTFKTSDGNTIKVDLAFLAASSVMFDAIFIPGGPASISALQNEPNAILFINETYRHCKAIAATGEGVDFISSTFAGQKINAKDENELTSLGIVAHKKYESKTATEFINAIAQHRFWEREELSKVPA